MKGSNKEFFPGRIGRGRTERGNGKLVGKKGRGDLSGWVCRIPGDVYTVARGTGPIY
jgi:hypothetical protein